ncbi:MAG: hypothetical protein M1837_006761 [Sclerophora amabilis]|nr:MAG: hypothetical protein M1837_006761 [Sclerophora amabilis]
MQPDLSELFSRNLNLADGRNGPPASSSSDFHFIDNADDVPAEPPIKYSISQHYHHSAHLAPSAPSTEATTPSFGHVPTDRATAEMILSRNGVDHSLLFPSQFTLFQQANVKEQTRLIELWQSSPPIFGGHALANDLGSWPETSIRQEEATAKLRLQRRALEEAWKWGYSESHDSSINDELDVTDNLMRRSSGQISGGDGRDLDIAHERVAEPYILNGYEHSDERNTHEEETCQGSGIVWPSKDIQGPSGGIQYNHAVDPVYQHQEIWKAYVGQQDMDCQYGAYEQMNRFGDAQSVLVRADEGQDEEML